MADFSIIIVSYNNLQVICDSLNSIEKHNDIGERLQVIVVEQSPTDTIYDYLRSNYPWITLLRNENKGFGAGNNAGAAVAEAPYLLFLNPDTILLEPICDYAIKKFQENPGLGLFGVQLLDGEHRKNTSFMMKIPYGTWNQFVYKVRNKFGWFDSGRMYIQGADLFVRRDAFEKGGRFDEALFMYCEETDLCTRISKAGYSVEYDPSKRIVHLEGKSTEGEYASLFRKQIESFRYVCEKHSMPFAKAVRSEYRLQKMKLLLYKACRRSKADTQKQLVDTIKACL